MSEAREFWLVGGDVFNSKQKAEKSLYCELRGAKIIHVREVLDGEDERHLTEADAPYQVPVSPELERQIEEAIRTPSQPDHMIEISDSVIEAVAEAVGVDSYCCGRTWAAWRWGTMTEDDFPLQDDADWVADVAQAAITAYLKEASNSPDHAAALADADRYRKLLAEVVRCSSEWADSADSAFDFMQAMRPIVERIEAEYLRPVRASLKGGE